MEKPAAPRAGGPQMALDDDPNYGLTVGTLLQALRGRGVKKLW